MRSVQTAGRQGLPSAGVRPLGLTWEGWAGVQMVSEAEAWLRSLPEWALPGPLGWPGTDSC